MSNPELVDPEVATTTFSVHLDAFFAAGRGSETGWDRIDLDGLHTVVMVPATREDGTVDHYFVRLGAEYYDVWPPTVAFVWRTDDDEWVDAVDRTRWWPKQQNSPGFSFGLHAAYSYPDGSVRQLLCFSHAFEYYISNHNPDENERWRQGTHTVSATLTRVAQVLRAPNYIGPSGDPDS